MIHDDFRVTDTGGSNLNFFDLVGVTLWGDNVQGFDTKDEVLLSMKEKRGRYPGTFVHLNFRTIEIHLGIVYSRYSAEGRENITAKLD